MITTSIIKLEMEGLNIQDLAFVDWIKESQLTSLALVNMKINFYAVLNAISKLQSLKRLDLSDNNLN